MKKYDIHINTPDDFDRTDEDFIQMESYISGLINNLRDDIKIVHIRIPDSYNIQQDEYVINQTVAAYRAEFAKHGDYMVFATQFDIECINVPERIITLIDVFEDGVLHGPINNYVAATVLKTSKPKIILPDGHS